MAVAPSRSETFTEFVTENGARIQHGLMALLGPEVGNDAAAEALSYGWSLPSRTPSRHCRSGNG